VGAVLSYLLLGEVLVFQFGGDGEGEEEGGGGDDAGEDEDGDTM